MKIRWFCGLIVTADGRIIHETYDADGKVRSRREAK